MEVRREFFSKGLPILLGLSLILAACGRGGGFKSPSEEFFSEKTAPAPEVPAPGDSAPSGSGSGSASIPASLEKYITRLKPAQDLPLVAGRIDVRDVDTGSTVLERLGGSDYRFSCRSQGASGPQDVVLRKDLALLIKRDGEGGDSLRRDFEFALIRCR